MLCIQTELRGFWQSRSRLATGGEECYTASAYFRSPNCFATFNESGVVECIRVDAAACYVFTLVREVQTSFALVSFFFCVLVCAFFVSERVA